MTVRRLDARDCLQSCGLSSKGLSLCLFELNYTRIRGRTLRDESLETNTARDLEQVVRMFVEMDVGPVSPSSTSGYEGERQKPGITSQCEVILLRRLSPTQFIRLS